MWGSAQLYSKAFHGPKQGSRQFPSIFYRSVDVEVSLDIKLSGKITEICPMDDFGRYNTITAVYVINRIGITRPYSLILLE